MIYKRNKSAEERMVYFKGQEREETVLEACLQVIPVVLLIALILTAASLF